MTAVVFCVFCVFCVPCLSVFPSSSSFCTNSVCISLCNTGADPGAAQTALELAGELGVGARAVPLQLAPLLLRLLRLLRLASARRLAASLFVFTFCSRHALLSVLRK